jgi:hypothetical protein
VPVLPVVHHRQVAGSFPGSGPAVAPQATAGRFPGPVPQSGSAGSDCESLAADGPDGCKPAPVQCYRMVLPGSLAGCWRH